MNVRLLPLLTLTACFAPQPAPECRVVSTSDFAKRTPYFARLDRKALSSDCAEHQRLSSMLVGAEHYRDPSASTERLVLRPGRLVDLRDGRGFTVDGKPVPRVDSSDPTGAKLDATFTMPREPTNSVCLATGEGLAEQRFDAVDVRQADGGTVTLPALTAKLQFSGLQLSALPDTAGTLFFAEVVQTEGTCTASYELLAIHPAVACQSDDDCAGPNADAGRLDGAGLSPVFKASCDLDAGYCSPTFPALPGGLPKR